MKAPIWRRALLQCLLLPAAALSLPSAQDAAADSRPLGSEGAVSKTRDWGSLLLSGGAFITGVGALGLNWRNTQRIANMESAALERDRQIHTLSQSATAYTEQLDTLANRIAELQQKASAGDTAVAAHAQELQALRGQYADVAERLRTAERGLTRIWNARTTAQWVRQQAQFPDAAAARRQAVQLFTEAHNRRSLHQRGQLLQAFRVINGKLPPGVWEEFPGLGECIRSKLESLGFRLVGFFPASPSSATSWLSPSDTAASPFLLASVNANHTLTYLSRAFFSFRLHRLALTPTCPPAHGAQLQHTASTFSVFQPRSPAGWRSQKAQLSLLPTRSILLPRCPTNGIPRRHPTVRIATGSFRRRPGRAMTPPASPCGAPRCSTSRSGRAQATPRRSSAAAAACRRVVSGERPLCHSV